MSQPLSNTKKVQQEVDDVVGIMKENIDKVVQRGEKLENLQNKTGKADLLPDHSEDLFR